MNPGTSPELSGGDIDARWEEAESSGDESVGGSTAIPGQNDVDDLGKAIGVTYADGEALTGGEKQRHRDERRWERDPASSLIITVARHRKNQENHRCQVLQMRTLGPRHANRD
jgi:uncharacterized protein DUF6335